MWTKEFYGINILFDIRRTLLGLIPLVIYIIGEIIIHKRGKGKVWIRLAVLASYVALAVVLVKTLSLEILLDMISLMFFWALFILFKILTGQTWTPKRVINIFLDSVAYIFFLVFTSILFSGPITYKNNIVQLPLEIETTLYCINTGEYVSEDVILDNNSISLETLYKAEEQKGFIYADCVVIEGEYDYLKKTVSHHYIEDANVTPV